MRRRGTFDKGRWPDAQRRLSEDQIRGQLGVLADEFSPKRRDICSTPIEQQFESSSRRIIVPLHFIEPVDLQCRLFNDSMTNQVTWPNLTGAHDLHTSRDLSSRHDHQIMAISRHGHLIWMLFKGHESSHSPGFHRLNYPEKRLLDSWNHDPLTSISHVYL